MTLITSLADMRGRELTDEVAAKDIVRKDDYGREALVVPKGQRIPVGLEVHDSEVEAPKKAKRAAKKDTGRTENKKA
jgi:hypothetical protein